MIKRFVSLTLAAALTAAAALAPAPGLAADDLPDRLVVTAGGTSGTYYRFASGIEQVAAKYGVTVDVVESQGSVQNIRRLLGYEGPEQDRYYQLAFVQGDVLEQLREDASTNPTLRAIVSRIKVVVPLYVEEVHLYSRSDSNLNRIQDLFVDGRVIGAGKLNSGSLVTAQTLFRAAGEVELIETFDPLGGDDALRALMRNRMHAFFDVVGAPGGRGNSVQAAEGQLKLMSIELDEIEFGPESAYVPKVLTSEQYPWLTEPVETIGVTAFLVTFEYDEESPYCEMLTNLTRSIIENQELLARENHPKWDDFDQREARQRSDLHVCARRGMLE
ncbi:MAG: hypothetical protein BM562_06855 [Alphaproteobacteria bacterium MedPE-SWcel]|nr:MAG: hypothetical protein BM562_06855 [Alphaproteobacteria bacterium MedPE-SWcel]